MKKRKGGFSLAGFLVGVVAWSLFSSLVFSGDLYLDATFGDDAYDGLSWGTAKQTIQDALSIAASDDTLHVAEGDYVGWDDGKSPYKAVQITVSNLTLLGGYPAGGGTRDPAVYTSWLKVSWGVRLGASWVTLDGFRVTAFYAGGNITPGIRVGGSDCVVRGNRIINENGDIAIEVWGDNALIENNEVNGFIPTFCAYPTDCHTYTCGSSAPDAYGISMGGSGHIIRQNTLSNITGADGVDIAGAPDCCCIYGQGWPGGTGYGIYLQDACDGSPPATIENNTISNISGGQGGDLIYDDPSCVGDPACAVPGGDGGSAYGIYFLRSGAVLDGNSISSLTAGLGGAGPALPGAPGTAEAIHEEDPQVQCPVTGPLNLTLDSTSIADCGNGDGYIDPDETISLWAALLNSGADGAFNISGTLSTSSPWVTVTKSGAAFPDIAAGGSGTSLSSFIFDVLGSTPCATNLDFTLTVTADGEYPKDIPLSLTVGSPGTPGTIFSEDFNAGLPPTWTVIDGGPTTDTWTDGDPCGQGLFPDTYMICDATCPPMTSLDEDLITPLIDCSSMGPVTLEFEHVRILPLSLPMDTAEIKVRSTCTAGEWVTKATQPPDGMVLVDITEEASGAGDVQIMWHYINFCTKVGCSVWAVDNVSVKGTPWTCNATVCSGAPVEPSPSASLDPLTIPTAADQIIVGNVADETHYIVYENAIGNWYGAPSQTCLDTWNDLGSTVELGYSMAPGDRWVVVSTANAAGESSCGMDSTAVERNTAPGWPAVGPCP
jgi:hypothetical protein